MTVNDWNVLMWIFGFGFIIFVLTEWTMVILNYFGYHLPPPCICERCGEEK